MTRQVAKLYPGMILAPADAKPGDTIGAITGLVTASEHHIAYGGFDYHSAISNEKTTARQLSLPAMHCDDLLMASERAPLPVGFKVVIGPNGRVAFRRYTP